MKFQLKEEDLEIGYQAFDESKDMIMTDLTSVKQLKNKLSKIIKEEKCG